MRPATLALFMVEAAGATVTLLSLVLAVIGYPRELCLTVGLPGLAVAVVAMVIIGIRSDSEWRSSWN